jgi:molybdopterin molybdotransferase
MKPPISLAEAHQWLLALAEPLGAESLPIEHALGRYLAEPLAARRTQPTADLSAMDGYAVRLDDLAGPWTVIGESAAGHPYAAGMSSGQAVRISTGALMPAAAGAVLLQENAAREGDTLTLNGEGDPSPQHIRRAGFDFADGESLLSAGTRLGAGKIALALAAGHPTARIHTLPSLAVLDSGDELAADPAHCGPHQIPASNGAMLAAMVAPYARSVARLGPVRDTMEAMAAALAAAGDADVIVTSGGASVGDHDLVRPALEAWGARIDFWRVAIKPGKPLLIARKGAQIVVGLPGNPVSSYVTAFLFLLPLLRKLAGAAEPLPKAISARLGGSLPAGGARLELVRARWVGDRVRGLGEQDSSALRSLAAAEVLIERAVDAPPAADGDVVQAYLLDNGGTA